MFQKIIDNQAQQGLLALMPFFLVVSSLYSGISTGLIIITLLLIQTLFFFVIRNLIPLKLRFVTILIVSISIVLIANMILSAEKYNIAINIGFLFPLLVMNTMMLSFYESVFSYQKLSLVMKQILTMGLTILFTFLLYSIIVSVSDGLSFLTSPAACLILVGFIFALFNCFNKPETENSL